MQSKIDAYIAHRRQGGFALTHEAMQLANFARFADKIRHRGALTLELASRWALANRYGRAITAYGRQVVKLYSGSLRLLDCASLRRRG